MKIIALTQGQFTLIDDEDYKELNKYKWYALRNHNGDYYAVRQANKINGSQRTVYMHKEITGNMPGFQIDHKSRNTLDNRKLNLRLCTPAQNSRNKKNQSNSYSQYKGVSLFRNKWKSEITCDGIRYYLGLFNSEIEAAIAYNEKASILFKEFANLNILRTQY